MSLRISHITSLISFVLLASCEASPDPELQLRNDVANVDTAGHEPPIGEAEGPEPEDEAERVEARRNSSPWTQADVEELLAASGTLDKLRAIKPMPLEGTGVTDATIEAVLSLTGEVVGAQEASPDGTVYRTETYAAERHEDNEACRLRNVARPLLGTEGVGAVQVSDDDLLARARGDFGVIRAGLFPFDDASEIHDLLARHQAPEQVEPAPAIVASRKVFTEFYLGGVHVRGPRLILGYYPDGQLHKVSIRAPHVQSGLHFATALPSDGEIVARVHQALISHPLGQTDALPRTADVELVVTGGRVLRVITVTGKLRNGTEDGGRFGVMDVFLD